MYFTYDYFFKISVINVSLKNNHPTYLSVLCISSIVCYMLLEEISGIGNNVMIIYNSHIG